jgi:hypothetical protein
VTRVIGCAFVRELPASARAVHQGVRNGERNQLAESQIQKRCGDRERQRRQQPKGVTFPPRVHRMTACRNDGVRIRLSKSAPRQLTTGGSTKNAHELNRLEGQPMSTSRQRAAARRNVKKAAKVAKRKRTIAHMPKRTRTALGEEGATPIAELGDASRSRERKREDGASRWCDYRD